MNPPSQDNGKDVRDQVWGHARYYKDYGFPKSQAEANLRRNFRDLPEAEPIITAAIPELYPEPPPAGAQDAPGWDGWATPPPNHEEQPGKPYFNLLWLSDIQPNLDRPALVRGVITACSMVVTYGESNSGKTFHTLDRDLCIALGRKWYGRETEKGFVLYIAAEGAHSVINRLWAYRNEYIPNPEDCLFAVMPGAIDLLRHSETQAIIDFIKRKEDELGIRCIKVTADTLARVMMGNENSPEDMGKLVRNADSIRTSIDCCFEFVHHSGKDAAKGARGHSSLRAATDTEIEICVRGDGVHVARTSKQRDFEGNQNFAFRLKPVEIGMDRYGYPVTTCVPEWVMDYEAPVLAEKKEKAPPDQAIKALALLRDLQQQAERNVAAAGSGLPQVDLRWFNSELEAQLDIRHAPNRSRILKILKDLNMVVVKNGVLKPI